MRTRLYTEAVTEVMVELFKYIKYFSNKQNYWTVAYKFIDDPIYISTRKVSLVLDMHLVHNFSSVNYLIIWV